MADSNDPSTRQHEEHLKQATSPHIFPQQQQNPTPQVGLSAQIAALDIFQPWLTYTAAQAQELQRTVAQSTDSALQSARSQLDELQTSSSHRFRSAQGIFDKLLLQCSQYEDAFFGKLKEGLQTAGDHSAISFSVVAGMGLLLTKRPRRFLYRHTVGRFQSDESLLVSSEKKVKEMCQSMDLLKNESKKLEERARFAEDELQRGQAKLKQAAGHLQNLVNSIHKTEDQARGLMDSLRELPAGDALKFRAEVASMAAEAKQQRIALNKKFTKIANYGISV